MNRRAGSSRWRVRGTSAVVLGAAAFWLSHNLVVVSHAMWSRPQDKDTELRLLENDRGTFRLIVAGDAVSRVRVPYVFRDWHERRPVGSQSAFYGPAAPDAADRWLVEELETGWPLPMLRATLHEDPDGTVAVGRGLAWARGPVNTVCAKLVVPTDMLLAGQSVSFALGLTLSTFAWCGARTVRSIRRTSRIHRSLCPHCGYPSNAAQDLCPECGGGQ